MKRGKKALSLILSFIIAFACIGFMPNVANATPNSSAVQVVAGANHTLVRLANGEVWAWGNNSHGQLGVNPATVSSRNTPARVMLNGNATYIAAGYDSSYAIVGGRLYAWGNNSHGQLGVAVGTLANNRRYTPTQVAGLPNTIIQVAAGEAHVLARSNNHEVWAFGRNDLGQAAAGFTQNSIMPTMSSGSGSTGSIVIAAGSNHSLSITQGNILWGSGNNADLQIARPSSALSVSWYNNWSNESITNSVSGVAAGSNFTLTLVGSNVFAYGRTNTNGIVGHSGSPISPIANRRASDGFELNHNIDATNQNITYIAAGHNHALVVNTSGVVFAWGSNIHGQLGNGTTVSTNAANFRPVRVDAVNFPLISTVAGGGGHSLAICDNGSLWAWGNNAFGQLGNGNNNSTSTPVQILRTDRTWTAQTASGAQGDFVFSRVGNYYTITGFVGTVPPNATIVIPNTGPSGAQVRTVAGTVFHGLAPSARNNITSITFQAPSNVTTIAANAFSGLIGLRSATIPASVQSIGTTAFANNMSLVEVHFEHLSGATLRQGQVFADASIFAGVPSDQLRLTRPAGTDTSTYIPFTSPIGVTRNWSTGDGNFAWWTVTPASGTGPVTIIGYHGPSNLTSITIPSTIGGRTVIGVSTHVLNSTNVPNLQEVVIPASVVSIASNAISGFNLVTVRFLHYDGSTIGLLPPNAFGNPETRNANFRILYPTHSIGFAEPMWRGFPSAPTHDGHWEYSEWTGQGLIITGFTGSNPGVQVPASIGGRPVRYIGPNVFQNNTTMRELSIPPSVVFISDNAVNNAPNLEVLHLQHTNADVFTYFPNSAIVDVHADFRVYFPSASQGFSTPLWNGFDSFPQRWSYTIAGGAVTVTGYTGHETVVTIPSSIQGLPVRTIAAQTFTNNPHITSIIIPSSVTTIQSNAVFNCLSLTSVVFSHTDANTITYFTSYAFVGIAPNFRIMFPYGASGFTTPVWRGYFAEPEVGQRVLRYGDFEYTIRRVTLPGTGNISRDEVVITRYLGFATTVVVPTTIAGIPVGGLGDAAFFQNATLTQVTLPHTLRTIGNNSFAGATNITTITLPASVTEIGNSAFMGASRLVEVAFNNSNGMDVTIGANAFVNTALSFRITYPPASLGFSTPSWRGQPAFPRGSAPPILGGNQPGTTQPGTTQPAHGSSVTVRTTDTFPGVTGAPIFFRDGVGYISIRAFAILIGSDPATEILFNQPINGWATIIGRHTDGRDVMTAVTSNDERVSVMIDGVHHAETDLAAWAGPLTGRDRGQLSTINEGGNIFLPFRAVGNIFGYDIEMIDGNTLRFFTP